MQQNGFLRRKRLIEDQLNHNSSIDCCTSEEDQYQHTEDNQNNHEDLDDRNRNEDNLDDFQNFGVINDNVSYYC